MSCMCCVPHHMYREEYGQAAALVDSLQDSANDLQQIEAQEKTWSALPTSTTVKKISVGNPSQQVGRW